MKQIPEKQGALYVVATPIGNMDDITLRAMKILNSVELVAAEDTRNTARLLSHHGISTPLLSFHEHNEAERTPGLIEKLGAGISIALVSDAGTPLVSDPGYRLVATAIEHGISVIPIPGPSAAVAALSVSGMPTDTFLFAGFLPKKKGKRLERLKQLAQVPGTLIFYESPKRVVRVLEEIRQAMGDRQAMLAREMTKSYEEFIRGKLSDLAKAVKNRQVLKGECTLLVSGRMEQTGMSMDLRKEIESALSSPGAKISHISRQLAEKHGISKKIVYQTALELRNGEKASGEGE